MTKTQTYEPKGTSLVEHDLVMHLKGPHRFNHTEKNNRLNKCTIKRDTKHLTERWQNTDYAQQV